jgi:HTH-type transcriptional repressor of NAD biosynthesis genes
MSKILKMPEIGVYFGKLMPSHRGHLSQILHAATQVKKLYVIVSEQKVTNSKLCTDVGLKYITGDLRIKWLKEELKDMPHVIIKLLDETNLPVYPNGWKSWTNLLQETVGENIDLFFCGEMEYVDQLGIYFPNATVKLFDPERSYFNISATKIRNNPIKYWDYILGPARPFFAKKVLITGPKNSGKTILAKTLAKMYHTSWSEGKEYDEQALRTCNRVCFFDKNDGDFQNYDMIFIIDEDERYYELLRNIYINAGYTVYNVKGDYHERLNYILNILKEIL